MGFEAVACDCRTCFDFEYAVLDNPNERNETHQCVGGGSADALLGGCRGGSFGALRNGYLERELDFGRKHKPCRRDYVGLWGFTGQ